MNQQRTLVATSSHYTEVYDEFYKDFASRSKNVEFVWVGETSKHKTDLSKFDLNYDCVIIQWNSGLLDNPDHTRITEALQRIATDTLREGGVVVHLFELIKTQDYRVINAALPAIAPCEIIRRPTSKTHCTSGTHQEGIMFNAVDSPHSSALDITSFIHALNRYVNTPQASTQRAIVKAFTTLIPSGGASVHVSAQDGLPVLLTRNIGRGMSVALAFGFCGGWNKRRAGVKEFRQLLKQIVNV